jgi:F-type H+-transporting ATPase subunit epsilon
MATFPAQLVTPERLLLDEEVQAVILRTDDGDATFLAGHTPLVGALVDGVVRFQHEDGSETRSAVHGGFVHVDGHTVTVLAPVAELVDEIDLDRARRSLERATALVSELALAAGHGASDGETAEGAEAAEAAAAVRRAEVRIEVAGS